MNFLTENFEEFLHSIYKGFNSDYITNLPQLADFPDHLFNNNNIDFTDLILFINELEDPLMTAVLKRIAAILLIQKAIFRLRRVSHRGPCDGLQHVIEIEPSRIYTWHTAQGPFQETLNAIKLGERWL